MPADSGLLPSAGELLQQFDAGYERRPQQDRMAEAVWESLHSGKSLVIEAGTGIGKSLGYLLPGAFWSLKSEKRLLVSTHTRALQQQLMEHELPLAAEILAKQGLHLRYAMLMGAENYLCVQRLEKLKSSMGLFNSDETKALELASVWASSADSGHRSQFPGTLPPGLWSRLCRDPDLCLGPQGPAWERCLYRKDYRRAEAAHIVVVNHALLLSGARLPDHDALVLDEAHNLEEAATSHFGFSVSERGVSRLLSQLAAGRGRRGILQGMSRLPAEKRKVLASELRRARGAAKRFFAAIAKDCSLGKGRADVESARYLGGETTPPKWEGLEAALSEASEYAVGAQEAAELKRVELRLAGLREEMKRFVLGAKEGTAEWVERREGTLELHAAPLEVGERLADSIFSKGLPAILTSATLSSGEGLREFLPRVGLEGAVTLALGSPFDYESQAALWLVDDLPHPQEEDLSAAALAQRCREIINVVPGGLFILFSSWKSLRRVYEILRREELNRPVWAQGESGVAVLLEEFAAAGNAVLLGVDTLWQGIDVPGPALSCVVLTKLPFPNFTSPVEEARREYLEARDKSYFAAHSLPRAVMKFRQGFGRLIRSSTDRGAFVILDSRLLHKGYGKAFLEALPRCRRLESLSELKDFFQPAQR